MDFIELAEFQSMIGEGLEGLFPGRFWVKAEIREWSPRSNGHCYLSLTQTADGRTVAECRATIWRNRYQMLKTFFEETTGTELRAGITVVVSVQVNFHAVYGYSLNIDDIDPSFTLGEKALQRQRTIERLTAEGYLEMQKELCLPALPYRLAVISSPTAAGLGDFRNHLLDNEYGFKFRIDLFESTMQGESAPPSIISAIEAVAASEKPYDAVLILRGGGSELDLACFDDYSLAVAIATCPVPVFTAIGHDRDYHIADMAANRHLKTPTALADELIDCYIAEDEAIAALVRRIRNAAAKRAADMAARADGLFARLRFAAGARISSEESRIGIIEAKIAAADPRTLLSRGYVIVAGPDGRRLKSSSSVSAGDGISVRFADGTVRAVVQGTETDEKK